MLFMTAVIFLQWQNHFHDRFLRLGALRALIGINGDIGRYHRLGPGGRRRAESGRMVPRAG